VETETKKPKVYKVDAATALTLWNGGKTLDQIAVYFSNANKWDARYAISRAVKAGLGEPRRGRAKRVDTSTPPLPFWE
jgi:hypothetical protein